MTLSKIFKQTKKLITENSPGILTTIGVTGTAVTAYLTGRASFKAARIIDEENHSRTILGKVESGKIVDRAIRRDDEEPPLELKESVKLVWKLYIPAAGVGGMTIGCIIAANRIGTRRAAAIAAAYSISEKAFSEYKEKVVEKMGARKEQAVRDEVAQDRVNANPPVTREIIITSGGDVLCYDAYSGRYFQSDMETLRKAENDVNHRINWENYASLGDFYDKIGLDRTNVSDDVGWDSDSLLDLSISTTMSKDDRPCLHVAFSPQPKPLYYKCN